MAELEEPLSCEARPRTKTALLRDEKGGAAHSFNLRFLQDEEEKRRKKKEAKRDSEAREFDEEEEDDGKQQRRWTP